MGVSDELTARILEAVREGPLSPSDLATVLGVSKSVVERHISLLENYGILRRKRRGLYALSTPIPDLDEVLSIIRSFEESSRPARFKGIVKQGSGIVLDFGDLKLRLKPEDVHALHRFLAMHLEKDPFRQALHRLYWALREGKMEFSGKEIKQFALQPCVKAGLLQKRRIKDPVFLKWRTSKFYTPSNECVAAFKRSSSAKQFIKFLFK